jgi:hypothetical protein
MSRRREQLAPGKPNVIVFESYVVSGDDVTVHIDVQSEARMSELEAITRKLSTGEVESVTFLRWKTLTGSHLWQMLS